MNQASTHYFEYDATTTEVGKPARALSMQVWSKGEKRLIALTAPADMQGTKLLILSATEQYVYLPSFGKVRRIASHTSDQGFMGMAFAAEDLADQRYSLSFEAKQEAASDLTTKLTLTPRPGQATKIAKIQMTISKSNNQPTELLFYGADGKLAKTESRSDFLCKGKICTPTSMVMVDHARNVTTTVKRPKWKVNEPVSDDLFTKRNLER